MKNPVAAESRRLLGLLDAALLREARLWKVPLFKNGCIQGADISLSQHQQMIVWIGEMNRLFQFCPETFALGVCVLNRLLSTVKAQRKYLKCIAFTSLVLAAKINEEDEVIGSVKDLVVRSGCNFSTAEILRMERIILDKLHWDLYTATPVDFVHIVSLQNSRLINSSFFPIRPQHFSYLWSYSETQAVQKADIANHHASRFSVPHLRVGPKLHCAFI
ncbi:cyclin-I-like [Xiphophorus maculatus]|uniref:cyclin-I-like n=1 Tax=Xiphophorus maculatus TaxID=8083 RepID=UPI0003B3D167|nr:cyclin-I-like [Xiphophorus maculatus]